MKESRHKSDGKQNLRAKAERALRLRKGRGGIQAEDLPHLIHELQVHQIELEMQNDELRKAQAEVEESRARFAGLYDYAPVGYVTLNRTGLIIEANLTAANLFNMERKALLKAPFSFLVTPEDRPVFLGHRRSAWQVPGRHACELRLMRKSGPMLYASMESVTVESTLTGTLEMRSVIADITDRKRAEEGLRESEKELKRLSSELMSVQETERKRISWEIHDSIGQVLGGIKYTLESVIRRMSAVNGDQGWIESLQSILPMLQSVFVEVRKIQSDLRPPILDDLGLEAAVAWSCRQLQQNGGAQAETKIDLKGQSVPESLKTTIFRVVQEGLANVAKHSRASRVRLSLVRKGNLIELVIRDNGCGFDLKEVVALEDSDRGIGLSSMKERTERGGGAFSIDSGIGNGTTLIATWPI